MLNLNYSIKHKAKELAKKSIKSSTWKKKMPTHKAIFGMKKKHAVT